MNAIVRRTLVVGSCLGLLPLQAQEAAPAEATGTVSPAPSGEVTIVGDLPDGTPPPPWPPLSFWASRGEKIREFIYAG